MIMKVHVLKQPFPADRTPVLTLTSLTSTPCYPRMNNMVEIRKNDKQVIPQDDVNEKKCQDVRRYMVRYVVCERPTPVA